MSDTYDYHSISESDDEPRLEQTGDATNEADRQPQERIKRSDLFECRMIMSALSFEARRNVRLFAGKQFPVITQTLLWPVGADRMPDIETYDDIELERDRSLINSFPGNARYVGMLENLDDDEDNDDRLVETKEEDLIENEDEESEDTRRNMISLLPDMLALSVETWRSEWLRGYFGQDKRPEHFKAPNTEQLVNLNPSVYFFEVLREIQSGFLKPTQKRTYAKQFHMNTIEPRSETIQFMTVHLERFVESMYGRLQEIYFYTRDHPRHRKRGLKCPPLDWQDVLDAAALGANAINEDWRNVDKRKPVGVDENVVANARTRLEFLYHSK